MEVGSRGGSLSTAVRYHLSWGGGSTDSLAANPTPHTTIVLLGHDVASGSDRGADTGSQLKGGTETEPKLRRPIPEMSG